MLSSLNDDFIVNAPSFENRSALDMLRSRVRCTLFTFSYSGQRPKYFASSI